MVDLSPSKRFVSVQIRLAVVKNDFIKTIKGKVAIGKAKYLLSTVYLHLDVQFISFPVK